MRRFLVAVAFVLSPDYVRAQSAASAPSTAAYDSAFARAFDAYDRRDWIGLARLAHPASLVRYHDRMIEMRRMMGEIPLAHVDVANVDTTAARAEVRKYYESWAALSPEALFVREAREHVDPWYSQPSTTPTVTRQVLGYTLEGDTLVHVVFRYTARWTDAPPQNERVAVDVLTLRRAGAEWRPTLNGGLTVPIEQPFTVINAVQ